jgi:7-cyano-7-deazaguanine synthase
MKRAIIYSGGMDSTVLLYAFRQEIDLAITFDYGSKHNHKEIESAFYHTQKVNVPHLVMDLKSIGALLESDLLKQGGEIPDGHYEEENMKKTVVPFRNGIMLSVAVGIAESTKLEGVFIANHAGDHAVYPDCRMEFIGPMNEAAIAGTYNNVAIYTPFLNMTKREIAQKGKQIGIEFENTWSCYKGGDMHCGRCGTCVERIEALLGFDPTEYEDTEYAINTLDQWQNK